MTAEGWIELPPPKTKRPALKKELKMLRRASLPDSLRPEFPPTLDHPNASPKSPKTSAKAANSPRKSTRSSHAQLLSTVDQPPARAPKRRTTLAEASQPELPASHAEETPLGSSTLRAAETTPASLAPPAVESPTLQAVETTPEFLVTPAVESPTLQAVDMNPEFLAVSGVESPTLQAVETPPESPQAHGPEIMDAPTDVSTSSVSLTAVNGAADKATASTDSDTAVNDESLTDQVEPPSFPGPLDTFRFPRPPSPPPPREAAVVPVTQPTTVPQRVIQDESVFSSHYRAPVPIIPSPALVSAPSPFVRSPSPTVNNLRAALSIARPSSTVSVASSASIPLALTSPRIKSLAAASNRGAVAGGPSNGRPAPARRKRTSTARARNSTRVSSPGAPDMPPLTIRLPPRTAHPIAVVPFQSPLLNSSTSTFPYVNIRPRLSPNGGSVAEPLPRPPSSATPLRQAPLFTSVPLPVRRDMVAASVMSVMSTMPPSRSPPAVSHRHGVEMGTPAESASAYLSSTRIAALELYPAPASFHLSSASTWTRAPSVDSSADWSSDGFDEPGGAPHSRSNGKEKIPYPSYAMESVESLKRKHSEYGVVSHASTSRSISGRQEPPNAEEALIQSVLRRQRIPEPATHVEEEEESGLDSEEEVLRYLKRPRTRRNRVSNMKTPSLTFVPQRPLLEDSVAIQVQNTLFHLSRSKLIQQSEYFAELLVTRPLPRANEVETQPTSAKVDRCTVYHVTGVSEKDFETMLRVLDNLGYVKSHIPGRCLSLTCVHTDLS